MGLFSAFENRFEMEERSGHRNNIPLIGYNRNGNTLVFMSTIHAG